MKTVENDFDKAYDELSKLYESETLEEKDGLKKAAIAAGLLASTAGLGACTQQASTPVNRTVDASNSQVISQDSNLDSEYSSLSYNDVKGSSSSMSESQKALSILNAASDIQYVEQEKDELGYDIFNTYSIATTINYDQKRGYVTVEPQWTAGHPHRVLNENIKVLDKLEKDIVMEQTLTSIWVQDTGIIRLFLTTETYQQLVTQGFKL